MHIFNRYMCIYHAYTHISNLWKVRRVQELCTLHTYAHMLNDTAGKMFVRVHRACAAAVKHFSPLSKPGKRPRTFSTLGRGGRGDEEARIPRQILGRRGEGRLFGVLEHLLSKRLTKGAAAQPVDSDSRTLIAISTYGSAPRFLDHEAKRSAE